MKRIFLFGLFILMSLNSFGQITRLTVKKAEFDTLHFASPAFQPGLVVFNDGARTPGALNIDCVRQMVMFIDTDGKIQELVDNDKVARIAIGKRVFYRYGADYVELVNVTEDMVGLGRLKTINIIDEEKTGAYGYVSQTTNITTFGSVYTGGQFYELKEDQEVPLIQKFIPYIYRNERFTRASKKAIEKAFPEKKAEIAEYLKANKVDFENYSQVEALFNAIK